MLHSDSDFCVIVSDSDGADFGIYLLQHCCQTSGIQECDKYQKFENYCSGITISFFFKKSEMYLNGRFLILLTSSCWTRKRCLSWIPKYPLSIVERLGRRYAVAGCTCLFPQLPSLKRQQAQMHVDSSRIRA